MSTRSHLESMSQSDTIRIVPRNQYCIVQTKTLLLARTPTLLQRLNSEPWIDGLRSAKTISEKPITTTNRLQDIVHDPATGTLLQSRAHSGRITPLVRKESSDDLVTFRTSIVGCGHARPAGFGCRHARQAGH